MRTGKGLSQGEDLGHEQMVIGAIPEIRKCSSKVDGATSFFMTSTLWKSHGMILLTLLIETSPISGKEWQRICGHVWNCRRWESSQLTFSELLTTNKCDISGWSDLICEDTAVNFTSQCWEPWGSHSPRKSLLLLSSKGLNSHGGKAAAPRLNPLTLDVYLTQRSQKCHDQIVEMIKCDIAAMSPVSEESGEGSSQPVSVENKCFWPEA